MDEPREVLERLVFSVGEQDYRWADVATAARAWSRWTAIEQRAGLRSRELPTAAELNEAEHAFRYARGLLAADEMEAWLEHWGLTTPEWTAYLRRQLAPGAEETSPGEREVWAEAVCSGALAELARELAARAAATEATGAEPGPVDSDLDRMDAALAELSRDAITPEAREKTLELRSSDWVRLTYSGLELGDAGMASEAALLIRKDGLSLGEVADRAGVQLTEQASFIEEVDQDLSKHLLSAPPGELVGPLPYRDRFLLLCVDEKIAPSLADPVIQDRLDEEVPRRALEREVRNRVRWHERL